MGKTLKLLLPPLISLAVGLGAGFFLGWSGVSRVRSQLVAQQKIAAEERKRLGDQVSRCQRGLKRVMGRQAAMRAREQLLRARLELDRRNYGLASQHLGTAKKALEKTTDHASISADLARVQTLTMQLKPAAQAEIEKLLKQLTREE